MVDPGQSRPDPPHRALWDDEIRLSSEGCSRGWPPCRSTSCRTRRPPPPGRKPGGKGERAWILHFLVIMGPYQVLEDLVAAYASAMGPGRDAEALGLAGGGHHELEDVEEGIEALAARAAAADGGVLARAIEAAAAEGEVTDDVDLEAFRALPGGEAFVEELERFLEVHGHLGQNHDDLRFASWAEAPRMLFGRIAPRLRSPAPPAREREQALARRADELADQVRAALADKPDELAAFETTLAHAGTSGG